MSRHRLFDIFHQIAGLAVQQSAQGFKVLPRYSLLVAELLQEFLKLNDLHIRFVCDKLVHMTTEVKNMDAVCLNLLWNASLDIEIDAQAAFNRDYAAGKI